MHKLQMRVQYFDGACGDVVYAVRLKLEWCVQGKDICCRLQQWVSPCSWEDSVFFCTGVSGCVRLGFIVAAECEIFEGHDFPAAPNLNDGNEMMVKSPAQCCSLCKATQGTYIPKFVVRS